jgi:hypothetical protein
MSLHLAPRLALPIGSGVLGAYGRGNEADPYDLSASWPSTGRDSLHRTGGIADSGYPAVLRGYPT